MKGNKKILVAIALLLLISISFTTYAIYRSSATGTGTIKAAKWDVKVKGTSIESTTLNLDFGINDITWTNHTGKNGTIAPGDSGTITIPVTATGSEVDVLLTARIGSGATLPTGFTAEVTSGTAGVQTIAYNATSMTANVVVTITWTGTTEDSSDKDTSDKSVNDTNLSIPLTLEARQKLSTD